jgi:hypothetical protein
LTFVYSILDWALAMQAWVPRLRCSSRRSVWGFEFLVSVAGCMNPDRRVYFKTYDGYRLKGGFRMQFWGQKFPYPGQTKPTSRRTVTRLCERVTSLRFFFCSPPPLDSSLTRAGRKTSRTYIPTAHTILMRPFHQHHPTQCISNNNPTLVIPHRKKR